MRYHELRDLYPEIDEMLSQVSYYAHGSAGPELAFGWAERWIARYVAPEHREAFTEKVQQLIVAIEGAAL